MITLIVISCASGNSDKATQQGGLKRQVKWFPSSEVCRWVCCQIECSDEIDVVLLSRNDAMIFISRKAFSVVDMYLNLIRQTIFAPI